MFAMREDRYHIMLVITDNNYHIHLVAYFIYLPHYVYIKIVLITAIKLILFLLTVTTHGSKEFLLSYKTVNL